MEVKYDDKHIHGSPYPVTSVPAADPSLCTVSGLNTEPLLGQETLFTIDSKDSNGTKLLRGKNFPRFFLRKNENPLHFL